MVLALVLTSIYSYLPHSPLPPSLLSPSKQGNQTVVFNVGVRGITAAEFDISASMSNRPLRLEPDTSTRGYVQGPTADGNPSLALYE